jgi:hypothetical protein
MAKRQSHNVICQGLAIRLADGVLSYAHPGVLAQAGFMEYFGPANASPAEALAWVRGKGGGSRKIVGFSETVDLRVADKDLLLDVAANEYATVLDGSEDTEVIRAKVIELAKAHLKAQREADAKRDAAAKAAMERGLGDSDERERKAEAQMAAGEAASAAADDGAAARMLAQSQMKAAKAGGRAGISR